MPIKVHDEIAYRHLTLWIDKFFILHIIMDVIYCPSLGKN